MKCPKCGSENISDRVTHFDYHCIDCKNVWKLPYNYDIKKLSKEAKHQQRLDKVLSKFEEVGKGYYRYDKEYKGQNYFVLDYRKDETQFNMMTSSMDLDNYFMPIDLDLVEKLVDTVEHLIKDMEETK